MCTVRLGDDPNGLICDNDQPHQPHKGCTYTSPHTPDGHDVSEARAEATR